MTIENSAKEQQAADRAFREQWMRTLLSQPKEKLTPGERLVGAALAWHMNMEPGNAWYRAAWPKAGTLCEEVGMTEGSTTNALKSLWLKGWLKRIGRSSNGRGSWVYRFIYPEGVTLFDAQTPSANGVHSPMESTSQWGETAAGSGVRPQPAVGSDPTGGLRESLKDSPKDSMNDPINSPGGDIGSHIREFKDTYPKRAALHLLKEPFKNAMAQGATPDQLILAAGNYAKECKRLGKEMLHIKFPTNFLKDGEWENYLTEAKPGKPSTEELFDAPPNNDNTFYRDKETHDEWMERTGAPF